jgi:hypothetical protein
MMEGCLLLGLIPGYGNYQGCVSAIAASNAEDVHVQSRPGFEYVELFSVLFVVASCVCVGNCLS